jgi:cytochrome P450
VIQGPIFRYSPNGVLVNSDSGFRSIYGGKANVKRGKLYEVPPRNERNVSTFNLTDRIEHRSRRRILNGVFSEAAVPSAEAFVIKHINRWCEILLEKDRGDWTEPLNMSKSVHCLVFDIMGDLAFGRSFDIKEPGGNQFSNIPETLVNFAKFVYPVSLEISHIASTYDSKAAY